MPEARQDAAACVIGINIYVTKSGNDHDVSVLTYNTEANAWSVFPHMPDPFHGERAEDISASVLDGVIYTMGLGCLGKDVLRYEPASEIWSTLANTLECPCETTSFILGGCLNAVGGSVHQNDDTPFTVERYDTTTDTWTEAANMLKRRSSFCAITIGSTGPTKEEDLLDLLIEKVICEQR
jgi:hypothetical protein